MHGWSVFEQRHNFFPASSSACAEGSWTKWWDHLVRLIEITNHRTTVRITALGMNEEWLHGSIRNGKVAYKSSRIRFVECMPPGTRSVPAVSLKGMLPLERSTVTPKAAIPAASQSCFAAIKESLTQSVRIDEAQTHPRL